MCFSLRIPSLKASIARSTDTFIAAFRILVNHAMYVRIGSPCFWMHLRNSSIPTGLLNVAWKFFTKVSRVANTDIGDADTP